MTIVLIVSPLLKETVLVGQCCTFSEKSPSKPDVITSHIAGVRGEMVKNMVNCEYSDRHPYQGCSPLKYRVE